MKHFFQKYIVVYLAVILIAVSFVAGLLIGQSMGLGQQKVGKVVNAPAVNETPDYLKKSVDFDLFRQVWDLAKKDYVDRDGIVDTKMFYGALSGIVASLGDPYSAFFDPKMTQDFAQELQGSFEGIGAELGIKKDQITVISPLPATPAYQAGLQAGDMILNIDDKSTAGMTLEEAVSLIRGPQGTKVKLKIFRTGFEAPKDFEITRQAIHFDSVTLKFQDNLAIITVSSFSNDTISLFDQAVREVLTKNPKGIILDLRGNPGGYLDEAVQMGSEWIASGSVVLEQEADGSKKEYQADLTNYPTVVLVNGGSASAAEIVAGALQDAGKATIVGEQTFGKGSVQEFKTLPDGSAVKLTIARWLTPLGRSIDKEGIKPDVEVKLTKEQYDKGQDPQMEKAVELLTKQIKK